MTDMFKARPYLFVTMPYKIRKFVIIIMNFFSLSEYVANILTQEGWEWGM